MPTASVDTSNNFFPWYWCSSSGIKMCRSFVLGVPARLHDCAYA
jgi:hypothetical protein